MSCGIFAFCFGTFDVVVFVVVLKRAQMQARVLHMT